MIRRNLRTILLSALVCGLLAAGASVLRGERYSASSTIELAINAFATPSPFDFTTPSGVDAERVLSTEREYLESQEVFEAAARKLGIAPRQLSEAAEVTGGENSNTLVVKAEAPSFDEARAYSRAVSDSYVELRASTRSEQIDRQIAVVEERLQVLRQRLAEERDAGGAIAAEYARWATSRGNLAVQASLGQSFAAIGEPPQFVAKRARPGPLVTGMLGALLGGILAAGYLLLRRQTSDRIEHASEAAEITGWGTLGSLLVDEPAGAGPRVRLDDSQLRALAGRLDLLAGGEVRRVAVVGVESVSRTAAVAAAVAEAFDAVRAADRMVDPEDHGTALAQGVHRAVHVAVGASWVDQAPDVVLLVLTLGESRPEEVRTFADALSRRTRAATALVLLERRRGAGRGGHRAGLSSSRPRAAAPTRAVPVVSR